MADFANASVGAETKIFAIAGKRIAASACGLLAMTESRRLAVLNRLERR